MGRSILAVIGGFVVWSALWVFNNTMLRAMSVLPSDETQPLFNAKPLIALLAGSVICSLVAGYIAATINRGASKAPITALGILLLAVGIAVESQYWRLMPLWYHAAFLVLLLPACFLGARLRGTGQAAATPGELS